MTRVDDGLLADELDSICNGLAFANRDTATMRQAAAALRALSRPSHCTERREALLGWNGSSNARHEVKVRDYIDKLKFSIADEITARFNAGADDLYSVGCDVIEMPMMASLLDFALTEQNSGPTAMVDEILQADAAPPEASFDNAKDMLDYLNAPSPSAEQQMLEKQFAGRTSPKGSSVEDHTFAEPSPDKTGGGK